MGGLLAGHLAACLCEQEEEDKVTTTVRNTVVEGTHVPFASRVSGVAGTVVSRPLGICTITQLLTGLHWQHYWHVPGIARFGC